MTYRYAITIQNPLYSLEVFVWDREARQVLVSYSYPELTIAAQHEAKDKCRRWIKENTAHAVQPPEDYQEKEEHDQ